MKGKPQPSSLRLTIGVLLALCALLTIGLGFMHLMEALEGPGYGSPEVRNALALLGGAGAAMGAGISLLIWEGAARVGRW